MQPDYRLRAAGAGPAATTDFLVVECKQYKRSSKRNFSAALTDYARASPFAQVVLVNYGPVLPSVLATVPDDVVDSCHAHGRVLPGGEGLPLFVSAVTNVALGVLGHPLAAHWLITEIEATILWGGRDVDLDLWVWSTAATIAVPARGSTRSGSQFGRRPRNDSISSSAPMPGPPG